MTLRNRLSSRSALRPFGPTLGTAHWIDDVACRSTDEGREFAEWFDQLGVDKRMSRGSLQWFPSVGSTSHSSGARRGLPLDCLRGQSAQTPRVPELARITVNVLQPNDAKPSLPVPVSHVLLWSSTVTSGAPVARPEADPQRAHKLIGSPQLNGDLFSRNVRTAAGFNGHRPSPAAAAATS